MSGVQNIQTGFQEPNSVLRPGFNGEFTRVRAGNPVLLKS
jgi:hypothetical protein